MNAMMAILASTGLVLLLLGLIGMVQRADRAPTGLLVLLGAMLIGSVLPDAEDWLVMVLAAGAAWASISASVWIFDSKQDAEEVGVHRSEDRPPSLEDDVGSLGPRIPSTESLPRSQHLRVVPDSLTVNVTEEDLSAR